MFTSNIIVVVDVGCVHFDVVVDDMVNGQWSWRIMATYNCYIKVVQKQTFLSVLAQHPHCIDLLYDYDFQHSRLLLSWPHKANAGPINARRDRSTPDNIQTILWRAKRLEHGSKRYPFDSA
jgi:hypothetical protein